MLKVGLTGSIAVGKSYVCEIFRELGADALDADQTARQVVAPGTEGLEAIVKTFGAAILQANGELDRAKLGAIVFGDEAQRQLLNRIVHPLVLDAQDVWLREREASGAAICIVDAALMIESGGYRRFEKLIVVWCEAAIQLQRLMRRNSLSEAEALRRIGAQMPQAEKKRFADFLIDTSGGFEATREQTTEIFGQLQSLSR